jgi:hypothetical protein
MRPSGRLFPSFPRQHRRRVRARLRRLKRLGKGASEGVEREEVHDRAEGRGWPERSLGKDVMPRIEQGEAVMNENRFEA